MRLDDYRLVQERYAVATQVSSNPVWERTAPGSDAYPALEGKGRAEVVVIGGGFCGLSAALHLAEAGRTVVLLDSHEPGWGASGRNGGHVIPGLKLDPDRLSKHYGAETGELLTEATGRAPDLVFDIIERYSIQCSPRRTGWIQLAAGPNGLRLIEDRVRQMQTRSIDVEILDRNAVIESTGAEGYVGGMIDRRGGNINPLAYARGLARALTSHKATIYGRSRALSIKQIKGKWVVETESGQMTSTRLVLCTNAYTDNCWPRLAKTIVPFVTGAVATEPLPQSLRESILPGGQAAADNCRLLSWFGLDPEGRLIFGGRTGTWSESTNSSDYRDQIRRMHAAFPGLKNIAVEYQWCGKVALTADHLPHAHKLASNLYTGLGFNGMGVAMSTLMGKFLAQWVNEDSEGAVFPLSPLKTLPLHGYLMPVVKTVVLWRKFLDRFYP